MPRISNFQLTISQNLGNADVTATWDVHWSSFDQNSGLQYRETFKLIGDDTGQDGEDLPIGDDPIDGTTQSELVSYTGQAVERRTKTLEMEFDHLDDDDSSSNTDDEIRAVVTYDPLLPKSFSQESTIALVEANP